jgi:hypothetical protein
MDIITIDTDFGELKLNAKEHQQLLNSQQMLINSGYEIDITSLTAITKKVIDTKYFTVRPSEYFDVIVGENAYASELTTYTSADVAGDFETGNVNTGTNNTELAVVDSSVAPVTIPVLDWGKVIQWSIMDLAKAQRAGNWNLIESKEKSRKRNWDLGIQKIAFVGSNQVAGVKGLLTQPDVTVNTSLITGFIKDLTAANFNIFVGALLQAYRANANYTAFPTMFLIPEEDYNGLASFVDPTYANKSRLEALVDALRMQTGNPNFQVKGLSYASQTINANYPGLNKNVYALYNNDPDSLNMQIPVDYTTTVPNSINNFQLQNVGYGQYSGCKAYRPQEMIYFTWNV